MASIFEEIRTERAALLKTISGLDAATIERPGVVGEWSVKDVLAHLAGWQDWMLRVYPARLETGEVPEDLRVTEDNTDEWNRRFVEERRGNPLDKVVQELTDGARRLMIYAVNLGATRIAAPNPWPGREASIADYLREHLVRHDRTHREAIERALRRMVRTVQ
jgi:uncharacterized protein (TIGR03083 family)